MFFVSLFDRIYFLLIKKEDIRCLSVRFLNVTCLTEVRKEEGGRKKHVTQLPTKKNEVTNKPFNNCNKNNKSHHHSFILF